GVADTAYDVAETVAQGDILYRGLFLGLVGVFSTPRSFDQSWRSKFIRKIVVKIIVELGANVVSAAPWLLAPETVRSMGIVGVFLRQRRFDQCGRLETVGVIIVKLGADLLWARWLLATVEV
ncbi:unnamed protein product, partial [Prorocentrum cordatum]